MKGSVTSRDNILQVQGDKVLVLQRDKLYVMTFVHVVGEQRSLHLVNREAKDHKPDWPVTQKLWEAIEPAPQNEDGAKWALEIA